MKDKPLTPLRSIKLFCIQCAGRPRDVRLCDTLECSLYPFRQGKHQARAGIGVCDRDVTGRFRRKETAQAGNSAGNNETKGVDKIGTVLIKPRGNKDEISICRKGQVSIQHKGGEILIKISPEKKEAQHVENSEGKKR